MLILIILLIAAGLVLANAFYRPKQEAPKPQKRSKEAALQFPVAKKYTYLYLYVLVSSAVTAVASTINVLSQHVWDKFEQSYQLRIQSQQGTYAIPPNVIRVEIIVSLIFGILFYMGIMSYLLLSKKVKNVTTMLKVFLTLNVLGMLAAITHISWVIVFIIVQVALTALTLRALVKKKDNLF
jgi:hypothetical protein